ncbi:chemotaxis protein [Xaviernesmea oryzae]|uniref:Chemotaxis protein n=1 Tax=Xaviernesmea oryzae TaxID=464029 RepID=A0A1Q9AWA1_9HYPH|nr:methyl-accepting chemotaxis protein [Xaviernesmea oryzae]OLP59752.1 chemotaxis protein [Xaviernesmea oryzae]SEM09978.1 methyl-accepting chemotaxis protein [Xaviernesmea oryzae]
MAQSTVRHPLWIKITAYGFAAVLFSAAAIGSIAWYRQSESTADTLDREAAADLGLVETDMAAQRKTAATLAVALAGEPDMAGLIEANSRDAIINRYATSMPSIIQDGGVTLITVVNAKGEAVARIHTPDKFGDDMTSRRKTVVEAIKTGRLVAGIEPGRNAVSMFASAPVKRDGAVVGVVDAGTALTNSYFARLAKDIGGEIAVHVNVDGQLVKQASTFDGTLLSDESLQPVLEGESVRSEISLAGRYYVVNARPLTNFSGATIGVVEIASDVTEVIQEAQEALWISIGGTLIVSLFSLIGFFVFARSLASVIGNITSTMTKLANGDLAATVEGGNRPDEVGAMARAVQVFKDNALRSRDLEQQAERDRSASEKERQRTIDADRDRTAAMAQATSGLANGLKRLSSGDLSFQLTERFADDFESLRADFNLAVDQLRRTLSSVADATSSIDGGSREISRSADDLSRRTEQQAASLEQTAAALDQITANVSNSSKRAEEARAVAVQANENARLSGAVVSDAVDAMSKIEQSSNQISSIIGVIDEIAFQTNLLALNAGVEAARAGEAGKGFAVVAQEVRELAQRSAQAAKEIKELIRNSSGEVQSGVKLVSQTGDALKTIEGFIVTINQHMDAIATSAREQSVGLSEVNTAVNQMDQVTQQNAAMVEETNAAGSTLATEAARLKDLVSHFQLGSGAPTFAQAVNAGPASHAVSTTLQRKPVAAAAGTSHPAPSPARSMVNRVARAFTAKSGVNAAPVSEGWEEF